MAASLPREASGIISTSAGGLLRTNGAEYMYLSADKSVLIFADMAEEDGEVYIGVAVRENPAPFAGDIAGDYLLAWPSPTVPRSTAPTARSSTASATSASKPTATTASGTSTTTTPAAPETGGSSTAASGTSPAARSFSKNASPAISPASSSPTNASTLVGFLLQDDAEDDPVLGLATRAFPRRLRPRGARRRPSPSPGEGAFGRQLVYQLGTDDIWEVTDLIAEAGGPAITGSIVTWIDPKDGHAYAAGMSDEGLILYSEPDKGDWTYRNLSDEGFGQSIAAGLAVHDQPRRAGARDWSEQRRPVGAVLPGG